MTSGQSVHSLPHLNRSTWNGRSIFISGHTGFKGAWLSTWLAKLGARVSGYALAPNSTPNMFELASVQQCLAAHYQADIRDGRLLSEAMNAAAPEVVFHLAAQPLVRRSYRDPTETWETNVMGTVHLFEAIRRCPSVKAVVVVTTDKCYENREWLWGYREPDPLGGHDPYSASKAGAELVVQSYRRSFFAECGILVASARAGNVIGGGDFSEDRLIPDAARAVRDGVPLIIRNPYSTRPWQHVLESLSGYLRLGERLLAGDAGCAEPFNFGPHATDNLLVVEVLARLQEHWPELIWQIDPAISEVHEARLLYLDSTKARSMLDWKPVWSLTRGLMETAIWYRAAARGDRCMQDLTLSQIDQFEGNK